MKKTIFMLLAAILILGTLGGGCKVGTEEEPVPGVPEIEWEKTLGGPGGDWAFFIERASDGGHVVVGVTESSGAGGQDIWLVKLNDMGQEEWNKTYGGPDDDIARSVRQTFDGGYVIAGYTSSYGAGGRDFYLVKTSESGEEEWSKTYGGLGDDAATDVLQTSDGGYIVVGVTDSNSAGKWDIWLVRTDDSGDEQWSKTYGGTEDDGAMSVQQTSDGGYIIAGWTESHGAGEGDFWVVKTDDRGDEEWSETYGGSEFDEAACVEQVHLGGYIVVGWTESYGAGGSDIWVVKIDDNGGEEWTKTFGGAEDDVARSVEQTLDGGYIIAGSSEAYPAILKDMWIGKVDATGQEEWSKTFGGSRDEEARSILGTSDGGYIIAGWTESFGSGWGDYYVVKVK